VDAWEKGLKIGAADLPSFHAHVAECPSCARRFKHILPLLLRDEEIQQAETVIAAGIRQVADKDFTENVMARIAALEPGPYRSGGHPSAKASGIHAARAFASMRSFPHGAHSFKLARIGVAAAALLVVALGLGIGIGVRDSGTVNVRFVLDAPEARTVELAANFTNWETSGYSLRRVAPNGPWELKVTLKKGSLYSYNFVIDGEVWIPDPSMPEKADDGFGGASSLLRL